MRSINKKGYLSINNKGKTKEESNMERYIQRQKEIEKRCMLILAVIITISVFVLGVGFTSLAASNSENEEQSQVIQYGKQYQKFVDVSLSTNKDMKDYEFTPNETELETTVLETETEMETVEEIVVEETIIIEEEYNEAVMTSENTNTVYSGYSNAWVSFDGNYAYTSGITIEHWVLDILYETWVQYPNLIEFDYLLGLIMKESGGNPYSTCIDTNGQRSSGLLQYNDYQSSMDGNPIAIIRNNNIPEVLVGQQAVDAYYNNPNTAWYTDCWDPTNVTMTIQRWSVFNSILHENGWSQQTTTMAHSYGIYNSALSVDSLRETEWGYVLQKTYDMVLPYRLY